MAALRLTRSNSDAEDAVMEVRKIRQIGLAGLGMVLASAPAFAQQAAAAPAASGGLNLIDMIKDLSTAGIIVAVILFVMSFLSIGVAIERIYTFSQARKQSKLYAPQVA